ncbi:MAG: hypothetical protein AB1705_11270 [Verrucomicrobiota bacterium]
MSRRRVKVVAGVLVFAGIVFAVFYESAPESIPLPNPNGYDDLVSAGRKLPAMPVTPTAFWDMSPEQLRPLVAQCEQAFTLARVGMERECRVPIEYNRDYQQKALLDTMAFKTLAQAMSAAGRLAELENRPEAAARLYMDMIKIGHCTTTGGMAINALSNGSNEEYGVGKLDSIRLKLDAQQCKQAARFLEEMEAKRETLEVFFQREKAWNRQVQSMNERFRQIWETQQSKRIVTRQINQRTLKARKLMLALAARAYELEHGRPPANASRLAPEYLQAVPKDPVTGQELTWP